MNTYDIGSYSRHSPRPVRAPRQRPGASVRRYRRIGAAVAAALALVLLSAACGSDEGGDTGEPVGTDEPTETAEPGETTGADETGETGEPEEPAEAGGISPDAAGSTVTLLTHDSFSISPETLEAFTEATGVSVEQLALGDTGELVSQAVLTAGNPLGDVLFGIDNTFLQRGLDNDIFEPYESPRLEDVHDDFELDPQHRVTPIDYGDVCLNYWVDAFDGAAPPMSLDDLLDPAHEDQLVVQNPETSSPGLAFMLATIAHYGDGWEGYWQGLRDNGVAVTSGWTDAYYGEFTAGGGERPIVVSYASSPPAEVYYADPPVDEPPTGVVTSGCYRQIEFAGVLAGSDNPAGARLLIDFMLTPAFQNDVPLNMFVFPVIGSAELPEVFVEHARTAEDPLMLDPAEVEAGRDAWTDRWTEIVLR